MKSHMNLQKPIFFDSTRPAYLSKSGALCGGIILAKSNLYSSNSVNTIFSFRFISLILLSILYSIISGYNSVQALLNNLPLDTIF